MPPPRSHLLLALLPIALALALLAFVLPRAAAGAVPRERWRWPVESRVLAGPFRYAPRHPFAAAQRRGVDLTAAPGGAVRAACSGRVTFAGPVPGRRGLGVTVRCGRLVATHLGLGRLTVRRGARIAAGTRLGAVGPAGRVRLGARRAADRFGYVDPLALLSDERPPVDRVAPLGRAPRAPRVPAPLRPLARPRPRPLAARAAARDAASIPSAAWAGLVVLAAGVPLGGLLRRSRRRDARRPVAATVAER
jgi:murein DD-endopeptidase MepM/ murein hydrolase activator NlpD